MSQTQYVILDVCTDSTAFTSFSVSSIQIIISSANNIVLMVFGEPWFDYDCTMTTQLWQFSFKILHSLNSSTDLTPQCIDKLTHQEAALDQISPDQDVILMSVVGILVMLLMFMGTKTVQVTPLLWYLLYHPNVLVNISKDIQAVTHFAPAVFSSSCLRVLATTGWLVYLVMCLMA